MLEQLNNIKREYEEFSSNNDYINLLNDYSDELNDMIKSFKSFQSTSFAFQTLFVLLMFVNGESKDKIINVHNNFYYSFDVLQSKGLLGKFLFNSFYLEDKDYQQFLNFCQEIEKICLSGDSEIDFSGKINLNSAILVKEYETFKKIDTFIKQENNVNDKTSKLKLLKKFANLKIYMSKNNLNEQKLIHAFFAFISFNNYQDIKYIFDILRTNLNDKIISFLINLENHLDVLNKEVAIFSHETNNILNLKYMSILNNQVISKIQKLERKKQKKENLFLKLINIISMWKDDTYISINNLNIEILSEELKQSLLLEIHNHNKKIFEKIYKSNMEFSENKLWKLQQLLIENNININFSDAFKENFSEESLEVLQLIINNKWDFCFKNNAVLEDILTNTDITKINVVNKTFQEFCIPLTFLENNYEILTSKYTLFLRNTTFIKNENIQIKDYEVFLGDSKKLLEFYDLACVYNLNLRKTKNNNNKFLTTMESFNYLDNYIELGLYKFIKDHLEFCQSKNENILKRVIIAQDLEILEESYFKEIVSGKNFFIPNECLDEVIINDENIVNNEKYHNVLGQDNLDYTENIYTQKLDEKYKISKYEYNFEGIIISRIKVIRGLNSLMKYYPNDDINELIFNAIIYNSYLSLDKLDTIHNLICGHSLKVMV